MSPQTGNMSPSPRPLVPRTQANIARPVHVTAVAMATPFVVPIMCSPPSPSRCPANEDHTATPAGGMQHRFTDCRPTGYAPRAGLEPAPIRLGGGRSSIELPGHWSGRQDLNLRLHGPQPCALPN